MKKVCFLLICSLAVTGVFARPNAPQGKSFSSQLEQTVTEAAGDTQSAHAKNGITRNAKDKLSLVVLGETYVMHRSYAREDLVWNLYISNKDAARKLMIEKRVDATCRDVAAGYRRAYEKVMTADTRKANDQIVSGKWTEEDGTAFYVVRRFIQVNQDVFILGIEYPNADERFQQKLFSAVQNTPLSVITQDLLEADCEFGSDCRKK